MSTQGDTPYDYKTEINKSLDQANLPKSDLAKKTNLALGSNANDVISQLLNAQNLGNSISPNNIVNGSDYSVAAPGSNTFAIAGLRDRPVNPNAINNTNPLMDLLNPLSSKNFSEASLSGVGGLSEAIGNLLKGSQNNDVRGLAGQPINVNTSTLESISKILGQKQSNDIADIRSRFGAAGGTSRGTPAAYAEAQLRSQQIPEMQQALSAAAGQEFDRGLASKGLTLQSLLGADSNNGQNLNTVLNSFSTTRGQDLQNTQGNQQNQLGLINSLIQAAGGAGQQNLGLQDLSAKTNLSAEDLTTQRLSSAGNLQNQGAGINNQANQFNAGQFNDMTRFLTGLTSSANEAQIGRQFSGLQDILQSIIGLTGSGTPGGSANVNVGNNGQYVPSQFIQTLSALGGLF